MGLVDGMLCWSNTVSYNKNPVAKSSEEVVAEAEAEVTRSCEMITWGFSFSFCLQSVPFNPFRGVSSCMFAGVERKKVE